MQPIFKNIAHGQTFETTRHLVFFGNHSSQFSLLQSSFPELQFSRIKQVHGDHTAHRSCSDLELVEADAQYSDESNLGLCISTADCMPILVYHPNSPRILAIHAGWRGVLNKITTKSTLLAYSDYRELIVFIGPHIQPQSFEIENTFRDQLLATCKQIELQTKASTENKSLVKLSAIVCAQLMEIGVLKSNIFVSSVDTFLDKNYHSYRRDKADSGRQISFICRKR